MFDYGKISFSRSVKTELIYDQQDYFLAKAVIHSPLFRGTGTHPKGYMVGGAVGFDQENVKIRAFAELIEHTSAYLSGLENLNLFKYSINDLSKLQLDYLDIYNINEINKGIHDNITERQKISWMKGIELTSDKETLIPALLSYYQWTPPDNEPIFAKRGTTGLAAHKDKEQCIKNALLEVLERDTAIMAWRSPNWNIVEYKDAVPQEFIKILEKEKLEVRILDISNNCQINTILAIITNSEQNELTCGLATGTIISKNILKAINEALMIRLTLLKNYPQTTHTTPVSTLQHIENAFLNSRDIIQIIDSKISSSSEEPVPDNNDFYSVYDVSCILKKHTGSKKIVCIEVSDTIAKESNWHIFRIIADKALDKETNYNFFSDTLGRYKDFRQNINTLPHPYG